MDVKGVERLTGFDVVAASDECVKETLKAMTFVHLLSACRGFPRHI